MQLTYQPVFAMRQPGAIAYVRVSDQRQVKSDGSLTRQAEDARQYAVRNGYQLVRVFIEEGETAKTDDRTVLQQMLRYCEQHAADIDVLIVPKVDRLSRVVFDHHSLKRRLLKSGIRLESVSERLDDSPSGRFMENMLAATAQFDNEVRAERCKSGMVGGVESGRWMWAAPFGFGNVKLDGLRPNIAPREPEASLVRRAFTLVDQGTEPSAVYCQLRSAGLTLSRSAFFKMLRHKIYIGVICAFGMEVPGTYPLVPLIAEDVFYRVQGCLQQQPAAYRSDTSIGAEDFPLRGSIVCQCGERVTGSWSTGKYRKYAYYHCHHCANLRAQVPVVHEQFVDHLNSYAVPIEEIDGFFERLADEWKKRRGAMELRRTELKAIIANHQAQRRIIGEKVVAGVLPDDLARDQLTTIDIRIAETTGELNQLSETAPTEGPGPSFVRSWLTRPGDFWQHLEVSDKRIFQSSFLPTGIAYLPESAFRTSNIELLELIKGVVTDQNPEWWTQGDSNS